MIVWAMTVPGPPAYLSIVNTKIYDEAEQSALRLVPNLHRQSRHFSLKDKNTVARGSY